MSISKIIIWIVLLITLIALPACTEKSKGSDNESSRNEYQGLVTPPENNEPLITGTQETETTSVTQKEYCALDESSISEDDMETAKELCIDAFKEYYRAIAYKNSVDFKQYINNSSLIEYMKYKIMNPLRLYQANDDVEFNMMESENYETHLYLSIGLKANYSGEVTYFLVKNVGGKLVIAEWYVDDPASIDVSLRGIFSSKDNLMFWDNPAKYEPVLEKIRSFS